MEEIILIGGGGHCKSCIDVIEQQGHYTIAGIVDLTDKLGTETLGYPIIGCDDDIPDLARHYDSFLITLGQIKSPQRRLYLFNQLTQLGVQMPTIISPYACVSQHTKIGDGTIVMHQSIVNAGAIIGNNTILNSRCLIEHDATIGDHCHISTGAIINGGTQVACETFVGSGCVVRENIRIGHRSIVGAGLRVMKGLADETILTE